MGRNVSEELRLRGGVLGRSDGCQLSPVVPDDDGDALFVLVPPPYAITHAPLSTGKERAPGQPFDARGQHADGVPHLVELIQSAGGFE